MKRSIITVILFFTVILLIPSMIVIPFADGKTPKSSQMNQAKMTSTVSTPKGPAINVAVYRASKNQVDQVAFHDYLVGVVASEMPAEFNIEALKAQALSARTYIVKQLLNPSSVKVPQGAEVTDTQMNQVYNDKQELKKIWGPDYDWKIARIEKAVNDTEGQIITYNGKPITPSFFSTSNGYTENAEDYWQNAYPYLKSVKSPWDLNSPKYLGHKVMKVSEVDHDLNIKVPSKDGTIGKILSKTQGHRVAMFELGGKKFSGRDVREKLHLRSTDFNMLKKGNDIYITTRGYGHGVGMSQYGANGMAKEGKNYKQILQYYYKGVQITQMDPYTAKITKKGV